MDEINKESKSKNNNGNKIGKSIFNILPKFLSNSININDSINSNEKDSNISELQKNNISKQNYKNLLFEKFKNESKKRFLETENDCDKKMKFKRIKLNDSTIKIDQNSSIDSSECTKFNFSYRSAVNYSENDFSRDFHRPSLIRIDSNQSLNESIDGICHGTTASRIYSNIFSQKSINITAPNQKTYQTTISSNFQRNRRFKTVLKRDKISKYLSRESVTDDLIFTSSTAAPLSFNLSIKNEDYSKRFNLSELRKIPENFESIKMDYWNCEVCTTRNPIHHNFCPSCSNPNPINKSNLKVSCISLAKPIPENSWSCFRCSTINEQKKDFCVLCFLGKNTAYVAPTSTFTNSTESNTSTKGPFLHSKVREDVNSRISKLFEKNEFPIKEQSQKWECLTCMVENDLGNLNCVCCTANNPNIQRPGSEKIPEGIKFGCIGSPKNSPSNLLFNVNENKISNNIKSLQKWDCPTCLVQNVTQNSACVSCLTENPLKSINTSLFGNKTDVNTQIKFGNNTEKSCPIFKLDKDSKMSNNTWDCPKSDSISFGKKTESVAQIKFGSNNEKSNSDFKFGDFNKIPNNTWDCPTCMVQNVVANGACVCCQTKNPLSSDNSRTSDSIFSGNKTDIVTQIKFGSNMEKPNSDFKFGNNNKMSSNTWDCPTCMVENVVTNISCVCCQTNNPLSSSTFRTKDSISFGNKIEAIAEIKFGSNMVKPNSDFKFGNINKIPNNVWDCPTCMVQNVVANGECVCCQTKNPLSLDNSRTKDSIYFGNKTEEVMEIKFGSNTKKSNSDFKFGSHVMAMTNNVNKSVYADVSSASISSSNGKKSFAHDSERSGNTAPSIVNGLDKVSHKDSEDIAFTFSRPIKVDYESNLDLDSDMEFVFSKAGVV